MSLVEGIGDEIIQFLGVLLVIVLGVIAWCSTRISEIPQIRTILIVERRSQNETNQSSSNAGRSTTAQLDRNLCENHIPNENSPVDSGDKNKVTSQSGDISARPEIQGTSENVVHEQDSNSQSSYETNTNEASNVQEEAKPEAESTTDNIRIRLKYLNDDQKLVEGRLQELLGDFKKRHFSVELSRQKRIRLIFNGQVLQSDDQTLQGCGLYDNCVVHCLIHAQQNTNRTNSQSNTNTSPPDWNLGVLLYTCLSLVLGFAWFFRYQYSHLFTLTTTAALVSLTGMFAVSIIGMYVNDEEAVPS